MVSEMNIAMMLLQQFRIGAQMRGDADAETRTGPLLGEHLINRCFIEGDERAREFACKIE